MFIFRRAWHTCATLHSAVMYLVLQHRWKSVRIKGIFPYPYTKNQNKCFYNFSTCFSRECSAISMLSAYMRVRIPNDFSYFHYIYMYEEWFSSRSRQNDDDAQREMSQHNHNMNVVREVLKLIFCYFLVRIFVKKQGIQRIKIEGRNFD